MRGRAFLALLFGALAALGTQVLSYGLVYPAGNQGSKLPLVLALINGALLAAVAAWLSVRAHRRATLESERFLALLGIVLSCFFLFVVVVGFGVPDLFLGTND
jgi:uncharacterized membrane protein (UPF0182 family)